MNYKKQALDFLEKTGTTLKIEFKRNGKHFDDDKDNRDIYSVTLSRGPRKFTFDFGQSINNSGKNRVKPTAYDILTCLTKYDPGTFENFCSEFGYDTDSRKAEKTYKAVVNEYQNIAMLFTDEELEELQEIQ